MFFTIDKAKETVLDFSKRTVKVFQSYYLLQYKMTQQIILYVKLSNLQLNELKSGIKNGTEVTLEISSNVAGDSNNENNFPHKF